MKCSKLIICLFGILGILALAPEAVQGAHFQLLFPLSQKVCDFLGSVRILGIDAKPGDEVGFFDRNGVLYGMKTVSAAGQYGFVHVYGSEGEGLKEEDPLTVRIWDTGRSMEWKNGCVILSAGESRGSSSSSPIPPVWHDYASYVVDVDTRIIPGDLDGDCDITIADSILSLRILSGMSESALPSAGSRMAANQQIGLSDAISILQKIAGVRN